MPNGGGSAAGVASSRYARKRVRDGNAAAVSDARRDNEVCGGTMISMSAARVMPRSAYQRNVAPRARWRTVRTMAVLFDNDARARRGVDARTRRVTRTKSAVQLDGEVKAYECDTGTVRRRGECERQAVGARGARLMSEAEMRVIRSNNVA